MYAGANDHLNIAEMLINMGANLEKRDMVNSEITLSALETITCVHFLCFVLFYFIL